MDNVFDGADLTVEGQVFPNSNNGFVNTTPLPGPGPNVVLNRFSYAPGPLGNYYQASPYFVDQGSRTADVAGLAHYTASPELVAEGQRIFRFDRDLVLPGLFESRQVPGKFQEWLGSVLGNHLSIYEQRGAFQFARVSVGEFNDDLD